MQKLENNGLSEKDRKEWLGLRIVEASFRQFRLAVRQMAKRKMFTAVVVFTLALGIGANTAIYSLANAVLFQPVGFANPGKLVVVEEAHKQFSSDSVSYPNFIDWRERQRSFSSIGLYRNQSYTLMGDGEAESLSGSLATHDYFEAVGVKPLLGRALLEEDDHPGSEPMALIGERLWRTRYLAEKSIIGQAINLDGQLYTVIGVLPAVFPIDDIDVWTSLGRRGDSFLERDMRAGFRAVARLNPEVEIDQARQDLESVSEQLALDYPASNEGWKVDLEFLESWHLGRTRLTLYTLLSASAFLLLIALVNVANMQLVRSYGRRIEFGVRTALGASRRQIIGQLAVESLTLGAIGGLLGVILAYLSTIWLKGVFAGNLPRIHEVDIDGMVVSYAVAVSIVSSFIFGLAPMRQALRFSQREALSAAGRASDSLHGRNWKGALVISQFALTSALLVCAGLMLRTAANLYQSDSGFDTDRRLTFSWVLKGRKYAQAEQRIQTIEMAQEKLSGIPGVSSVGVVVPLPLSGQSNSRPYYVEGSPLDEASSSRADLFLTSNNFFDAAGIKLISGRMFNQYDRIDGQPVVIVDRTFAERNFPNEDPLGKRIALRRAPPQDADGWKTVIGVVDHIKNHGLKNSSLAQMYLPIGQDPKFRFYSFVVKTKGKPMEFSRAVQKAMGDIDLNLPIMRMSSFDARFNNHIAKERLLMQLLGVFAAIALLLALVGIYGVLSYAVNERKREIGIRVAIGAKLETVRNLVLVSGFKLAGAGLIIGLAAAAFLSRFLNGVLYGVSALDGVSFASAALFLGISGLLVCWMPACRAANTAPINALRED